MLLALLNSQCCMVFQGVRSPLFTNDVTSEVAIKKVLIFEPDQKKRLDTEAEIMKAPQRGWLQIQIDFFRSHTGKEKPWKTCCHEMVMTKSRELSEHQRHSRIWTIPTFANWWRPTRKEDAWQLRKMLPTRQSRWVYVIMKPKNKPRETAFARVSILHRWM